MNSVPDLYHRLSIYVSWIITVGHVEKMFMWLGQPHLSAILQMDREPADLYIILYRKIITNHQTHLLLSFNVPLLTEGYTHQSSREALLVSNRIWQMYRMAVPTLACIITVLRVVTPQRHLLVPRQLQFHTAMKTREVKAWQGFSH